MLRVLQVVGIGLASGIGFVLPVLALELTVPGQRRTLALLVALGLAVLLIRRLGRVLHGLLDRSERPLRFPLLVLYAVMVMTLPAATLLLPPG
jgi:hypothetical protein